jgi:saccharopine dehydrogenase-like NADP-dependent oxidoreductase
MAAMNPAIFQYKNDMVEHQPGGAILKNRIATEFYKGFNLEAIANRDSMAYKEPYALDKDNVETTLRGTLRYQGYCDLVYGLKTIGLCSADKKMPENANSWADYLASFDYKSTLASDANNNAHMEMIISGMHDLGLTSSEPFADNVRSQDNVLDAFAMHLANNCDYKENERDLVLLRHEIISEDKSGNRDLHEIDFVHYGDREWSAMAKTVSLPLAICARTALENGFENQKSMQGLIRPLEREVYQPILKELRAMSLDSRYNVSPSAKAEENKYTDAEK